MYLGMPDTRAAIAFLKQEYGSYYAHSQTYQDGSHGNVIYTTKGIEFQRFSPSGSVHITWNRAAARLKELVSTQDYLLRQKRNAGTPSCKIFNSAARRCPRRCPA